MIETEDADDEDWLYILNRRTVNRRLRAEGLSSLVRNIDQDCRDPYRSRLSVAEVCSAIDVDFCDGLTPAKVSTFRFRFRFRSVRLPVSAAASGLRRRKFLLLNAWY
jgi:hypothetical protein